MIKATNIKIINGVVYCDVNSDGHEFTMSVPIDDWEKISFSDPYYKLDACHVRNRVYNLYVSNKGKLPKEIYLVFG